MRLAWHCRTVAQAAFENAAPDAACLLKPASRDQRHRLSRGPKARR
jgi:hypothetical protein